MYRLVAALGVLFCMAFSGIACSAGIALDSGLRTSANGPYEAHVTRLLLLGTQGGPSMTAARGEPANLLVVDGTPYLIDVGAGTVRQLAKAGYSPADIHTIFISHHHLDHDAGLVSFMSLNWFGRAWLNQRGSPVEIYGPPATTFLVNTALSYMSVSQRIFHAGVPELQQADSMFRAHDIKDDGAFFTKEHIRVTAVENTHFLEKSYGTYGARDKSYSYRFQTQAGSVVFTGDTGPSAAVEQLAGGVDVLVSEVCADDVCGEAKQNAMLGWLSKRMPRNMVGEEAHHMLREHLTPQQVGRLAAAAHVRMVILTHLVYGPNETTSARLVPRLTEGVKEFYSGPVMVGRDLFEYDLVKRTPAGRQ